MKIVDAPANIENLTKFKNYLFIGDNKIEATGKRFLELINDRAEIYTVALISLPNKENFNKIVTHNLYYLLEDSDTKDLNKLYMEVAGKVYLDAIYSFKPNQGNAKELLRYIEEKYTSIWLYATYEAQEFWDEVGWKSLLEYVYTNNKEERRG